MFYVMLLLNFQIFKILSIKAYYEVKKNIFE